MIFLLGATGTSEPLAASTTLALGSVAANNIAVSSLFCSKYKYNSSFTFCCLAITLNWRSCTGILPILLFKIPS